MPSQFLQILRLLLLWTLASQEPSGRVADVGEYGQPNDTEPPAVHSTVRTSCSFS